MCIILFCRNGNGPMIPACDENMAIRLFSSRDAAMAFVMKYAPNLPLWEIRDAVVQS